MIEVAFAAWIAIVGVLVLVPASRGISWRGAVFVAPLTGTAMFILSGVVLVAMSRFSVVAAVVVASAAALAIASIGSRRLPDRRWLVSAAAAGAAVAGGVAALAWQVPTVRLTSDSYHYLMSSLALVRSGTLGGVYNGLLLKRQLGVPLLHTVGSLTGRGYGLLWGPLLGVSTFGTMAWLAWDGMRSMGVRRAWRWGIVLSALCFAVTTNRVLYNFSYVNGHMLFAGLLLGGVAFGWLAVRTEEWALIIPASLMVGALLPVRAEAGIIVATFLVVFVVSDDIPARWRAVLLAPSVMTVVLWDMATLPRLVTRLAPSLLASPAGEAVAIAVLALLLGMSTRGTLKRFARFAPQAGIVVLVFVLGGFVAKDPSMLSTSVSALFTAATATGYWGSFWITMPILVILAGFVRVPAQRYLLYGLASFPFVLPILAYLRGSPYHSGSGDSGNRMLVHIVPLVVLVVALAAGRAALALSSDDTRTEPQTAISHT